jgi:hypothetical protein
VERFHTYSISGHIGVHEIAWALYFLVTGNDLPSLQDAAVLRNSIEDADDFAHYMDELSHREDEEDKALYAALKLESLLVSDERIKWHRYNADQWRAAILRAAEENEWTLFDLNTLAPLPLGSDAPGAVFLLDVIEWLCAIRLKPLADGLEVMAEKTGLKLDAPARPTDPSLGTGAAPEPKVRAQERWVLEMINELGYEPVSLPKNSPGKSGIKATIRDQALKEPALFTESTFESTWKRLRASNSISDE